VAAILTKMRTYKTIEPPFASLKFREMSKKELVDYNRWFLDVLPERIDELGKAVNSSPGFGDWKPTYLPDSLNTLGKWFAAQVQTRQHTPEELSSIPSHVMEWVSEGELTNQTISLSMDVGMYLGQLLLLNNPSLKWDQIFGSRKFIDYGQPVLVGFKGDVPLNPVHIVVTLAYGLAKKARDSKDLRKIYDTWIEMVKNR
jgi:hypothetical protein